MIDSVGSPAANESAVARSAPGATILVLGLDDRPLGLSARTLVRRQLELRGSLTYDHPGDFEHTIELVSSAKLDPGRIVAHEFELDDVQECVRGGAPAARQDVGPDRCRRTSSQARSDGREKDAADA